MTIDRKFTLLTYEYFLPERLIAQYPLSRRDECRLLSYPANEELPEHNIFAEVSDFLEPNDVLVLNDSKVFPARLAGRKSTGANVELLLLHQLDEYTWQVLCFPGDKMKKGAVAVFGDRVYATVEDIMPDGSRIVKMFPRGPALFRELDKIGIIPLPHYIDRPPKPSDRTDYQTIYAEHTGSVAAPTAGLHFTQKLLDRIAKKGVKIEKITLHVGLGTFKPIETKDIREHTMHREYFNISPETAQNINDAKARGNRIIAVGTTTTRALEASAQNGLVQPGNNSTDLFIMPGFKFSIVNSLVTNFHQPKSTLLVMVSAFAGIDRIKIAYRAAIEKGYRFYSYGDAMYLERYTERF